jgi:ribosomal protein L40E
MDFQTNWILPFLRQTAECTFKKRRVAIMVCVKCKANIPDNVKFCPRCGAKIEVQAEEKPSEKPIEIEEPKDVLVCPKCGTANPKSAKFCRKDGTPLIAGVVYPKAEAEKEIGRRPSRVWLWLIIFVLVLGAVGIGGYFYLPRFIGAKPKIVQEKINTELRENELGNILVEVSKEWVATVSGSVPSQNEKKVVLNIVRSHKKVK